MPHVCRLNQTELARELGLQATLEDVAWALACASTRQFGSVSLHLCLPLLLAAPRMLPPAGAASARAQLVPAVLLAAKWRSTAAHVPKSTNSRLRVPHLVLPLQEKCQLLVPMADMVNHSVHANVGYEISSTRFELRAWQASAAHTL